MYFIRVERYDRKARWSGTIFRPAWHNALSQLIELRRLRLILHEYQYLYYYNRMLTIYDRETCTRVYGGERAHANCSTSETLMPRRRRRRRRRRWRRRRRHRHRPEGNTNGRESG